MNGTSTSENPLSPLLGPVQTAGERAAREEAEGYFDRLARESRELAAKVEHALASSDAVVITARGGRRILAITTAEMSSRDEGSVRVTIFDADGPMGHITRHDLATIAKEIASDWAPDAIEPASEADVVAWTITERFAAGAERVAAVQRANAGQEVAS